MENAGGAGRDWVRWGLDMHPWFVRAKTVGALAIGLLVALLAASLIVRRALAPVEWQGVALLVAVAIRACSEILADATDPDSGR